jgi:hypothetical protein
MGRRRELTGVADALSAMFCGRTNDYEGAWLPGVLCRRLITVGTHSLSIDLLLESEDEISSVVAVRARQHVAHHCKQIDLDPAMVRSAVMQVDFRVREPNRSRADWLIPAEQLERDTWWFTVTVIIIDDLSRERTATRREWCWPDSRELPISGSSVYGPRGQLIRL